MSANDNPCLACGACCAARQVVFHVSESEEGDGLVPEAMTGYVTDSLRCMEGTDRGCPRCVALHGDIGKEACCLIYELRPSPCRDFAPHGLFGIWNYDCINARARHGLPPLPDPQP